MAPPRGGSPFNNTPTEMTDLSRLPLPEITDDAVQAFARDGFAIVRHGFDSDAIKAIARWTDRLASWPERTGGPWVDHVSSKLDGARNLIARIEKFSQFHAGFRVLAENLGHAAQRFLAEPAVLFKEKINFKMPGSDGFKPHQDSQAGWGDYADYFVTVMLCIDSATLANGCLELVAGHQRQGLYRQWEPLSDEDMVSMFFTPYPTEPGDLVFFDCYTPHASAPNLTDHMRRMYFATYNRASAGDHFAGYHADKFRAYPPDIDRISGREYVFRV